MAHADTMRQADNVAAMLRLSEKAQLARSTEWQKINLYHVSLGRMESRVDDPSYFLAANGKHDPQAELQATIRAAYDEGMAESGGQPKRCRWIARYQFLSRSMQALGFLYEPPKCEGYERWRSDIATDRVSLIFASIYLNSPASMYGHAFLRFDSAKAGEFNRLNDATIGYSVSGGADMGPLFLTRSLMGGFPGSFVFVPYYKKLREYADLENRDLWEYQTNLTPEEIDHMLAFVWEQSFTYMNYYFFDDNCALMLLAMFEAGRPSLNLLAQAKPWMIPLDSVKLVRQAGLVSKRTYRPSQYSTLLANNERATPSIRNEANRLARSLTVPGVTQSQDAAQTFDLALGIVGYQRNQQSEQQGAPLDKFQLELSGARSRIEASSSYMPATPPPESPDEGHDSFRVGIAQGRVGTASYTQINLRGGYHDGLDPQAGFSPGASSKIGDLYLRLNAQQVRFERLDLFDVFLPSVRTDWYRPLTLKVNLALRREVQQHDELSPTALRLEMGAGEGYRTSTHGQIYFMADGIARLAAQSNLAAGPVAGWVWQQTTKWRALVEAGAFARLAGSGVNNRTYRVSGGLARDVFNNQNNIRINAVRQWTGSGGNPADSYTDLQIAYFHYF